MAAKKKTDDPSSIPVGKLTAEMAQAELARLAKTIASAKSV